MIMVKRTIIYRLPRGNWADFPAQWSVRRFEIFEAPKATRKVCTVNAQAAQPWKW